MPGVYISFPFCAQKCTYCNFASGVFPRSLEDDYGKALVAEIEAHPFEWRPETVYLGGGTPSSMDLDALRAVLKVIPGRPWKEATLEASPGTVTMERARAWAAAGIDRVSLGVQSFVQPEIAATGRKHTAETVLADLETLRQAGIVNYNIDLIAGLAGQTMASWGESLDWTARLSPPHVSVYMLEVDEDSRLGREMLLGGVRYGAGRTPSDSETADMYETAVERLTGLGIPRYEISNFAKPGWESAHNLKYWQLEPYAGFGADAHSFDGRMRRQNVESPAGYVARSCPPAPQAASPEEKFFVGLRLSRGVRLSGEERLLYEAPIRRFVGAGLLETSGDRLRLTSRGVLLSNEVFQEFLSL
ncbi:MAG TPA: radical SAM family heme chaperone HemW [Bryobacteraceae bacterium]|nr:radical SAM family heme chaperone HemW [Bryobacteraceae bacterium]